MKKEYVIHFFLFGGGALILFTVLWLAGWPQEAGQTRDESAIEKNERVFLGMIKAVDSERTTISVDEVEFLSGEEAIQKGIEDTGCTRENIYDCIPSMNNDFYIRNTDEQTHTYTVDNNATVTLLEGGSPIQTDSSFDSFVETYIASDYLNATPFRIMLINGNVVLIEQQYIP